MTNALGEYWKYLQREASELYRWELQLWHHQACLIKNPGKPPSPPAILGP